jgi:hypothetical protein
MYVAFKFFSCCTCVTLFGESRRVESDGGTARTPRNGAVSRVPADVARWGSTDGAQHGGVRVRGGTNG